MEETIGLGFNSHNHGSNTAGGKTAFVSASAGDLNNDINIRNSKDAGGVPDSGYGVTKEDGSSSNQNANMHIIHMQQQQYNQQQPQQIQLPNPPAPHSSVLPQTFHYSQPHLQPQLQSQTATLPPAFDQPTSSTQPLQSSYHFPPVPPMQQPPPVPPPNVQSNAAIPQHLLPSFEPPPGLPPVALPSFQPPPPNNVVPPVPIPPPSVVPVTHSLPAPPVAMQAPLLSQHSQQLHEQKQQQQQQQQIQKARALALRFHQENIEGGGTIDDATIDKNINYAQLRQDHFQKERRKLQTFHLKNLEYVMKHEEKELRRHVECMNQMTAYEEKQQLQLQLQQEHQRQRQLQLEQKQRQREQLGLLNDDGGGIGTKEQRRAERVRKRQHLEHAAGVGGSSVPKNSNGNNRNKKSLRTSLYLTNLPIDGSTTERTLQSLFCLYGRLDRVTMYRHRSTGELKGDGLIVYGRDAVQEYQGGNDDEEGAGEGADLVEAVCTQMNGAELPCGTAIGVQPAEMDYKKKSKTNEEQNNIQPPTSNSPVSANSVSEDKAKLTLKAAVNTTTICGGSDDKNAKDDDDLDDFFASLE